VPIAGKVVGLGVDAERTADDRAKRYPAVFAVIAYPRQGAQMFTCPSSSAGATI
jgi:hypothetical protein